MGHGNIMLLSHLWRCVVVFLVLVCAGCGTSSNESGTASDNAGNNPGTSVRVAFPRQTSGGAEPSESDVERLLLTVTGPGITADLSNLPIDGKSIEVNVPTNIKATFEVKAFRGEALIFRGVTVADIPSAEDTPSAGITVTVVLSPVSLSIEVTPDTASIIIGENQQFMATGLSDGSSIDGAIMWASSNPEVATISVGGRVTAVTSGTTTITATTQDGSIIGSTTLAVNIQQVTVSECRALIFTRKIVEADVCLQNALAIEPANQEAHFFRAGTRLLRLAEDTQEGPDPNVFTDSFQEMLDRYGVTPDGRSAFDFFARPPENAEGKIVLPNTAPTGADIQTFLAKVVLPAMTATITELETIDATFSLVVTPEELTTFGFSGKDTQVEMDFGDLKAFLAGWLVSRGAIESTLLAYNIDLRFHEFVDIDIDHPRLDDVQIQAEIIDPHPALLTLQNAGLVTQARDSVIKGLQAYFDASAFVRNQDDADQSDDFFKVKEADLEDEEEFRRLLGEVKCSLEGKGFGALTNTGVNCDESVVPTVDDEPVNLNVFFDHPFDLRAMKPDFAFDPNCATNYIDTTTATMESPFPDPTFNGVLPGRTQESLIDYFGLDVDFGASVFQFSSGTNFGVPVGSSQFIGSVSLETGGNVLTPPVAVTNLALQDGMLFALEGDNVSVPLMTDLLLCDGEESRFSLIRFTPTAPGLFSDTVIVESDAPDALHLEFPIRACAGDVADCQP